MDAYLAFRLKRQNTRAEARGLPPTCREKDVGDYHVIQALGRHLGSLDVTMINSGTAELYVERRRQERVRLAAEAAANGRRLRSGGKLADQTLARELIILRSALDYANSADAKGWFSDGAKPTFLMPVETQSAPRVRHCTKEQAAALITAAPMPHLKLFLRIGFLSGARKEAIEELRWDDILWDSGPYGALDFGAVDHNKMRPHLGMTPELSKALRAAREMACSEWVIEYRGRKAGNVKNGIKATAKAAGLPWFTSHVMKHSVVTWMANGGGNKDRRMLLREIADHVNTTPDTLKRHYRHLFLDLDERVIETLTLGV